MTANNAVLSTELVDRKIFKRTFKKSDGRDLFLFGFEPHNSPPLDEDASIVAKGGELRWHPLRQEWNIYAAHRQFRTFKPAAADDPLAPTMLGGPPTEIPFADFELAVFENKFTSLHPEAPTPEQSNTFSSARAAGRCEVIVYGTDADGDLWSIGQDRRSLLVSAWIDRYKALYGSGCKFVLPFENRGDEVGVTLHHPHGQIYGFPFVPNVQEKAAEAFRNGFDLSEPARSFGNPYMVNAVDGISAYCPPFSLFPYEVWISPDDRHPGPWTFSLNQHEAFAFLLGDICRRYDAIFKQRTPYMLSLHAAPLGENDTFHFTAQFYPLLRAPGRLKYLASVEQSTGIFTVDVMPELAAKSLREV